MISPRISGLLALCVFAGTALAATPQVPTVAAQQALLLKMDPGAQAECHKDSYGNAACTSGSHAVEISGCDNDMLFGQVIDAAGATLGTRLDADHSKPVAKLKAHQFLCIVGVAKKSGEVQRYYVEAFPADHVPDCKGNHLCQSFPVEWVGAPPATKCEWIGTSGDFTGGCVAGWVDADAIDVYSMGLK
ncbi:hypothetical protein J2X57_003372 [Luteibacter sp. 1214]|uniref:hypothetical protein n=1 Tax=Luteibacter sp. 1214 TaxID=2817735 RepID=UPI002861F172|nr:hypothetical protein [Luteibacter sp. 1214]MDR6644134.1 hypothetical protein [Luteibacter sp. 1214]